MKRRKYTKNEQLVLAQAAKDRKNFKPPLPTKRDIRGVLADFINERVSLPDGVKVTPDWIEKNHGTAVKLVNAVRHDKPGPHGPQIVQR
jgi:hypothetical protein